MHYNNVMAELTAALRASRMDMDPRILAVKNQCIESLDSEDAKEHAVALAQVVADAVHGGETSTAADAMHVFFDMCCSGSGMCVRSNALEVNATAHVGVLILGYAGSSVQLLNPLSEFYKTMHPSWRVVSTVGTGLSNDPLAEKQLSVQLDAIIQALAGCRKVLVHVCSNNGHGLFALLLHRKRDVLRSRIAAVVYDCAASMKVNATASAAPPPPVASPPPGAPPPPVQAGAEDSEAAIRSVSHVIMSTVLMQAIAGSISLDDPASADAGKISIRDPKDGRVRGYLEAAALALARRTHTARAPFFWVSHLALDGFDVYEYR